MALRFILGNSGSGKSEYIFKDVVKEASLNPKKTYLVLVPEQFTMQTQRKLVDLSFNKAIMNIDILSFKRLAYRVFDTLGMNNIEILEETGKNLVLRKVAQEKEKELTVFRSNMKHMGYINEVKSFISELMQYNITPEQLADCIKEDAFSSILTSKLKDVEVMYRGFKEYLDGTASSRQDSQEIQDKENEKAQVNQIDIQERKQDEEKQINIQENTEEQKETKKLQYNYEKRQITADELLVVLSEVAEQSELLKDAVLVLDEFTGFTPIQVQLLRKLMTICSEIRVTLTIDAKENFYYSTGMQELFDMPKKTIRTLMGIAKDTNTEVLEPIVLSDGKKCRFANAPSLYFMEQNLFRTTYQRKHGKVEEIEIYSVKNPKEELAWTARKINQLVQRHGYRYHDIAVVTGAVDVYANYADSVFGKYEIPYFLDTTRDVLFHPFIEFIRSILEVVRMDFSYNAIMRLLRCGFCEMSRDEADMLENYLLAIGIRGRKAWSKKWIRVPKNENLYDLEILEHLRSQFMETFLPVANVFYDKKSNVKQKIKALYTYLVLLNTEQKLLQKQTELLETGEQAKAKEYEQIYRIVMDLFEKYILLLGEEVLSIEEFEEILDSGFEAAEVAVIPPGYDSVTIGDIERTRLSHVKILFFIGVNDGIVPKSVNAGGIISQYEREVLEQADMTLAPGAREQAFIQKFYLYLNLTKPSEQLYMSFSRVDSEGRSLRPSYLIQTIKRMFPDIVVHGVEDLEQILDVSTTESAKDYLILGEKNAIWFALAKCFLESEDRNLRRQAQEILDAFYEHYSVDPISHVVAEAIYGKTIEGSVTRLENFAKCAYAHFLQYGLQLKEREECGFESVDMGNLYHSAIEIYSNKLANSEYDWFSIPEEVRDTFAEQSMEEAVLGYPHLSIYATAENAYMAKRMNHIFRQTVWALTTQVRKGRFVPNNFEVSFSKTDKLDALKFDLGNHNKLHLKGRIDRLDTCEDDNRLYVKVIDYKSGNTKFDLVKLYHGLQLQLVIYMNAAMELEKKQHDTKEVIPGGLFYYHIDDPVIEVTGELSEEEVQEAILKELKPDGLVNREEAVYRAMDDEFETKSDVIPVTIKKSGELSEAQSQIASAEQFQLIAKYVNKKVAEKGKEIYNGTVSVNPYIEGENTSCEYCPYKSICEFDLKIPGFEYRRLPKLKKEDVYERMETDLALEKE
ncbi:MAG: exodeoxyribonuclease V subunit gamma [Lachnospiraceae bacterium]|nr:exodeoxyribonuclease V subunit gamma [Lachnospiraceae bacterium]